MIKFFNYALSAMLLIFVIFAGAAMFLSRSEFLISLYFALWIGSIGLIYLMRKQLLKCKILPRVLYIMLIAFMLRASAIYFLNLIPEGDYEGYLNFAGQIYRNDLHHQLYLGIFPHALNYPVFLSSLYRILGETTWLPRVVNLFLGVVAAGLAEFIMEKTVSPRAGLLSGLAIALNPSVLVFTLLSGAEPIYDALIMGVFFFYVMSLSLCQKAKTSLGLMLLSGVLCAVADFFRPTGIILIIALLIQIFLERRRALKEKLTKAGSLIAAFVIVHILTGTITASVSGYEKPAFSFGWNLYIGANEKWSGKWNPEDAEQFDAALDQLKDPGLIQAYFARQGFERYKNMGIRVIPHFYKKLKVWTEESFTTHVITQWQSPYTRFKSKDLQYAYNFIINLNNTMMMTGAVIGLLYAALSKRTPGPIKALGLYIAGSMMLFMVLETASRYKGAYYSALTLMAAYGFWALIRDIRGRMVNDRMISSTDPASQVALSGQALEKETKAS